MEPYNIFFLSFELVFNNLTAENLPTVDKFTSAN